MRRERAKQRDHRGIYFTGKVFAFVTCLLVEATESSNNVSLGSPFQSCWQWG